MTVTVTIVDNETGDIATSQVGDGDFFFLVTEPAIIQSVTPTVEGTASITVTNLSDRL